MLIRKTTIIAFITVMFALALFPYTSHKMANAANKQYEDLIGEWSAVWPGNKGDRSTIIVHELDEAKSKARVTYIVDLADEGHKEYEINAGFFTERPPTLKFADRGYDFTCVYKKRHKILDVSFVGDRSNSCEMKKHLQIFSQVDDLLEKNPLPDDKKAQSIMVADNDTTTISLVRAIEGSGLKPPFNPVGKVHTTKQVGTEPLVFLSIFTPGMEGSDRQFVE